MRTRRYIFFMRHEQGTPLYHPCWNKMLVLRLWWRAWHWPQPVQDSGQMLWRRRSGRRVGLRRMRHAQGGLRMVVTFQFLFLHVHHPDIPFRLQFLHYRATIIVISTLAQSVNYANTRKRIEISVIYMYNMHIGYLLSNHRVGAGRRTCWEGSSYRSTPALTNDHTYTTNVYFIKYYGNP